MRQSQGPYGDEPIETESRRLTPSIGLTPDSDHPTDSSNEDFLFHLYRGSELLQDNRVHEAKEELERALHLQPRDSKGQDLLAVVYFRLGLYPRAIQIYEQLRRRNATDTALLLNLALCYLKTGQPQLARRDLEQLLGQNPGHARAWGYLGLACERLGDLHQAERAFKQGGHGQMAKRIAARREAAGVASEAAPEPSREVREVAGAAYQELDAGELSFSLADPASDRALDDNASQSWRPIEPGRAANAGDAAGRSAPPPPPEDTKKPDTKDGPNITAPDDAPLMPSVPQLGTTQGLNRRPTLIAPVGAPPAHEPIASEFDASLRIPSHQPPSFGLDEASTSPSLRRPVVAVPSPFGPRSNVAEPAPLLTAAAAGAAPELPRRETLPPPLVPESTHGPEAIAPGASAPPQPASDPASIGGPKVIAHPIASPVVVAGGPVYHATAPSLTARAPSVPASEERPQLHFPETPGASLHPSGVVLVRTSADVGFVTRLESVRAQQAGLKMQLLERQVKGKTNGEPFGGLASPMVLAAGDGQLVLGPRTGRKAFAFRITTEMCFAREDVLLGFAGSLAYENGRLSTGEGESVPVVQLRGEGSVLLETMGDVLTLPVRADRSLSVRREVILGWFGRLVPRAIAPADAPCGQRGLVSFAGEGRVLMTSL